MGVPTHIFLVMNLIGLVARAVQHAGAPHWQRVIEILEQPTPTNDGPTPLPAVRPLKGLPAFRYDMLNTVSQRVGG